MNRSYMVRMFKDGAWIGSFGVNCAQLTLPHLVDGKQLSFYADDARIYPACDRWEIQADGPQGPIVMDSDVGFVGVPVESTAPDRW